MNQEERDLLIRVDQNVRNLLDTFASHEKKDIDYQSETNRRLSSIERIMFLGIGGLAVIQFLLTFLKNQ